MEPDQSKKSGQVTSKRVTPGRTAKNNKRKLSSSGSPAKPTREVKARRSHSEDTNTMSTPLTLEVLKRELAANKQDQIDHLDKTMLSITATLADNVQAIADERKERTEQMRLLNERIDKLAAERAQPRALDPCQLTFPTATRPGTREDDEYYKLSLIHI